MASSDMHADYLVDRRRMRRKLTFWRVAAFLVAIAAVLFAGVKLTGFESPPSSPTRSTGSRVW